MKRSLFFLVVLVLGFANIGAAQNNQVSLSELIALAKSQGKTIVDDRVKPAGNPSWGGAATYEEYAANELVKTQMATQTFMTQNTWNAWGQTGHFGIGDTYVQRAIDRDKWGGLKFKKGREMFMESVEIYGCGKRIIQADEANNVWDKIAYVPVDCSLLTFVYVDEYGEHWEVEVNEMIAPLRMQPAKNITLNKAYFEKALKRTSRLPYDMKEQPDGSFKKVPRNP